MPLFVYRFFAFLSHFHPFFPTAPVFMLTDQHIEGVYGVGVNEPGVNWDGDKIESNVTLIDSGFVSSVLLELVRFGVDVSSMSDFQGFVKSFGIIDAS